MQTMILAHPSATPHPHPHPGQGGMPYEFLLLAGVVIVALISRALTKASH